MASSSSTSTTEPQRKHHVFLSFRGEDTRVGFTSHLHAALGRENIQTFIDNDLKRGEEISPSLVKAIEDSMLSVIIFSEQYASSRWCLKELVKILECRKTRGQIVIPIFYKVDPSGVRNQSGSFGDAFAELVERKALEMEEERRFRDALKEAANISGHDSRNILSESEFIKETVKDILNKLSKKVSIHSMNLVGIDERIREIESVLKMESQEVRIVGIWGMGGIGKTTIAGAVYSKICTQFEAFVFVPNIREKLKGCSAVDLQRSFVSRLLNQEIRDMGPLSFGNHFVKDGLRHRRVLIVFDDVDSSMPLQELLLGQHDSFGPGSRILVTSRDRHVLEQVVDATYEVKPLNHNEALRLLLSKAFKKFVHTSDHQDLLERVVNYAKGNPLALLLLGSALCDRSKEYWYSKLDGLGQGQDDDILKVLRISYDGLNKEEKNTFLDIACFFRGMDRYRVTRILEKKSPSVYCWISNLIDKSLITASDNILWMHDLLQEMACSIVRDESENPGKRSRLFDPEDIYYVLEENEGTNAVKGIRLDRPASREIRLKSDAFARMRCLEVLIIKGETSKLKLPDGGFECLPEKLIYLCWNGYSSRSLSQNFCAANLVEFDFQDSKVEKLWSGRQELVNLKKIDLSLSYYLIELPDLSEAKQLLRVRLLFCESLTEVPSYFQYFEKLERLCLDGCYNLQSFPRKINSNNIKRLSLTGCSNIKKRPEIPANIEYLDLSRTAIEEVQQSFGGEQALLKLSGCTNITKFPKISGNIKHLGLGGTAIEEVPSSIQLLTSLQTLFMHDCKKLSILPDSICKLKSLRELGISGCSKLKSFPEIKEPMESLASLYLSNTAIAELPSSIQFLTNLKFLSLTNCKKLSILPDSICELKSLRTLHLDGCSKLESLAENMERMESLESLLLRGTAFRELPSSIRHLKCLRYLSACNCESLEIISINTLCDSVEELCFANCLKLDQKALMADMQQKIQFGKIRRRFSMFLPGSEIPQWFSYQSRGSSITIQFPSNPPNLKAIVFCLVIDDCVLDHPVNAHTVNLQTKINNCEQDDVRSSYSHDIGTISICELDHMYLFYDDFRFYDRYYGHEVTFEFDNFRFARHIEVKRCGIHLIFDENPDSPSIFYEDE